MATQLRKLSAYKDSRDAIVEGMGAAERIFTSLDYSADPASDYQKARAALHEGTTQLRALAINSLRELDSEIAASQIVSDIAAEAKDAKREANRIATAAATIEEVAGAIDKVAGVVTKISGLPFLN